MYSYFKVLTFSDFDSKNIFAGKTLRNLTKGTIFEEILRSRGLKSRIRVLAQSYFRLFYTDEKMN